MDPQIQTQLGAFTRLSNVTGVVMPAGHRCAWAVADARPDDRSGHGTSTTKATRPMWSAR